MPRISVLMAVYNGEKYMDQSIRSVLTQNFEDFEFVIVDDCSTDQTAELISSYADGRIVYLRNDRNLGQTASLNRALGHARSAIVARIDADDVYRQNKLSRQWQFMQDHPEVTVCGTWAIRIDAEGQPQGVTSPPLDVADVRFRLLRGVPVCHVSVVMRRDAIIAAGGYPVGYRFAADYALWSALVRRGAIITNIPDRLMEYREFPLTFGAAQKVGAAGDESASIIRQNARELISMDLSPQECRDIALLYFPAADLSTEAIGCAYLNLRRMAKATYKKVPPRVVAELIGILFWTYIKRWNSGHERKPKVLRDIFSTFRRFTFRLDIMSAALAAAALVALGPHRLVGFKDRFLQVVSGRVKEN